MKRRLILVGLMLVIGLLASRWYLGQSTQSPPPAGRVETGLRTQAANPSITPEKRREIPEPARPEPDKAVMERDWIELPSPQDAPGIIHNTGPFVDADPNKAVEPPPGPLAPVQNAGAIVDAGGPPVPRQPESGNVRNKGDIHFVPPEMPNP